MKVRDISIDFANAQIHWTPEDPEFSAFWNATSTFLPYLEPFLNKSVMAGMKLLPTNETELISDCKTFVAQEGQHWRNHEKLNQFLRASGYPGLIEREAKMKADYDRFWKEKGLKWCIGYAEGFETLGPIIACYFLEAAPQLEKATVDDPTADLWRWHLAEEYEHRHVANYLFHRLYGSYWYRLWGICYSAPHMLGYMVRTGLYMIVEDRKAGRIRGVWRSRLRFARMIIGLAAYVVPRVVSSLHPRYDPVNLPEPERCMAVLQHAEQHWGKAKIAAAV